MQFLEIYQSGVFYTRFPLGEIDLMEMTGNWDLNVTKRERIAKIWLRQFYKSVPRLLDLEVYLVFESKIHLVASDNALSIDCCDAPFVSSKSIEQ